MSNREDDVLDEIDRLVDESLARGDQSDSFHGEQYRKEQPCPWCAEGYHYLPITQRMYEMRRGSYAMDEFGQGIVDPAYRFEDDESPILCPGSEFHGPPFYFNGLKLWDKQGRERAQERSHSQARRYGAANPVPTLPPGRIRQLRFYGPFRNWVVSLDDERIVEDVVPGPNLFGVPGWPNNPYQPRPLTVEQRLTVSFELAHPIRNPSRGWLERNWGDVAGQDIRMSAEEMMVMMKPVVIPFRSMTVFAESPTSAEPEWIEFETSYELSRHPWFLDLWRVEGVATAEQLHLRPPPSDPPARMGFESDYVVIDEVHHMTNERLRHHVEEARSRPPSAQAYDEAQRRQAVFRRSTETP